MEDIERRSFLKTALAAFPLAALQQLSRPAAAGRAQWVAAGKVRRRVALA